MTVTNSSLTDFAPDSTTAPALADLSPKDKPWDTHKTETVYLFRLLSSASLDEFSLLSRQVGRLETCSSWLLFRRILDTGTGEIVQKLQNSDFCRVRICPVCQWRRTLMYQARFLSRIDEVLQGKKLAFLFLTLTVRNCPITELRSTLGTMREAWKRLTLRREFGIVEGWVRKTEVTRGKDGSAHPHYHCLLVVPPGYFSGKSYMKTARWVQIWRESLRADYDPICDVRRVRKVEDIRREVLKYVTKPSDLASEASWTAEYVRQVHHLRFIDSGGILKGIFRDERDKSELVHTGEDTPEPTDQDMGQRMVFGWRQDRYRLTREYRERGENGI